MKVKRIILATAAISALMTSTAFAGTWKAGAGANQNKWWYENDNGSYLSGCWQWIDGNGSGIAKCYYFDQDGWMLANTKTPDGYQVNADGAWTVNGEVQVKQVGAARISESDFVVGGNYTYCGGASYLLNNQTGQYELFAQTANASEDEWFNKIYPADAIKYDGFCIEDISENVMKFNIMGEKYQLLRYGNAWVYDNNLDGVIQESEKEYYSGWELLGDGRISISMVNEYDYRGEQETPYGWPDDKGTVMITAFYTKN